MSFTKNFLSTSQAIGKDLLALIYPNLCLICQDEIGGSVPNTCPSCLLALPVTDFFEHHNHPGVTMFWGRVPFQFVASHYFYESEGSFKALLHAIKYKQATELAVDLGRIIGQRLAQSPCFKPIDGFIPIPSGKNKLKERGYNPAELLAQGVADHTGIPLLTNVLKRVQDGGSQTRQTRFTRWRNVETAFAAVDNLPKGHYVIIDDVLTTGATLESAAQVLLSHNEIELSAITLAFSHKA